MTQGLEAYLKLSNDASLPAIGYLASFEYMCSRDSTNT